MLSLSQVAGTVEYTYSVSVYPTSNSWAYNLNGSANNIVVSVTCNKNTKINGNTTSTVPVSWLMNKLDTADFIIGGDSVNNFTICPRLYNGEATAVVGSVTVYALENPQSSSVFLAIQGANPNM